MTPREEKEKNEKYKEMIKGGKAEGKNCYDIAKMHGVPLDDIEEQVTKGAKIEHEHTPDNDIAKEIARDHLVEHPYYYDFLEAMEKEMEDDYDNEEYGPKKASEEEEEEDSKEESTKPMSDSEKAARAERIKKAKLKKLFG